MSNFLTDGRLGLMAALQGDAAIDARVRSYFDFGPGLRRRPALEPALCPALSLAPAEAAEERVANVEREVPQLLRVEVATAGQDVQPCEELAALVIARVNACNSDCLGLAADGLTGLRVRAVRWDALPRPEAARILWTAAIEVELLWRLADA
jgi:hypothetical protein